MYISPTRLHIDHLILAWTCTPRGHPLTDTSIQHLFNHGDNCCVSFQTLFMTLKNVIRDFHSTLTISVRVSLVAKDLALITLVFTIPRCMEVFYTSIQPIIRSLITAQVFFSFIFYSEVEWHEWYLRYGVDENRGQVAGVVSTLGEYPAPFRSSCNLPYFLLIARPLCAARLKLFIFFLQQKTNAYGLDTHRCH